MHLRTLHAMQRRDKIFSFLRAKTVKNVTKDKWSTMHVCKPIYAFSKVSFECGKLCKKKMECKPVPLLSRERLMLVCFERRKMGRSEPHGTSAVPCIAFASISSAKTATHTREKRATERHAKANTNTAATQRQAGRYATESGATGETTPQRPETAPYLLCMWRSAPAVRPLPRSEAHQDLATDTAHALAALT